MLADMPRSLSMKFLGTKMMAGTSLLKSLTSPTSRDITSLTQMSKILDSKPTTKQGHQHQWFGRWPTRDIKPLTSAPGMNIMIICLQQVFQRMGCQWSPKPPCTYDPTTHTLKKNMKKIRSKGHLTLPKHPKSNSPASHGGEAASMPMPTCGSHPGANIKMPYTRLAISQYKTYMAPMSHKTASHQGANKHGHSHNHYEEKVKEEYFNKEFEHGHSLITIMKERWRNSMRSLRTIMITCKLLKLLMVKESEARKFWHQSWQPTFVQGSWYVYIWRFQYCEAYASDKDYWNDGYMNIKDCYETCDLHKQFSTHHQHQCNGDRTPVCTKTCSHHKTHKNSNHPKPLVDHATPSQPKHCQC